MFGSSSSCSSGEHAVRHTIDVINNIKEKIFFIPCEFMVTAILPNFTMAAAIKKRRATAIRHQGSPQAKLPIVQLYAERSATR